MNRQQLQHEIDQTRVNIQIETSDFTQTKRDLELDYSLGRISEGIFNHQKAELYKAHHKIAQENKRKLIELESKWRSYQ